MCKKSVIGEPILFTYENGTVGAFWPHVVLYQIYIYILKGFNKSVMFWRTYQYIFTEIEYIKNIFVCMMVG